MLDFSMTSEEGILLKTKALFKRSEELYPCQFGKTLTRNVLCPLHVGCPPGGGAVSRGTPLHLPGARGRLHSQRESRTESRCLWPQPSPHPGESQAPRRPVPHMETCSAATTPPRSAPPWDVPAPGSRPPVLREVAGGGSGLTSDVGDGVVHGVTEQRRGQPRHGNGDSDHGGQCLPPPHGLWLPVVSTLIAKISRHQKPPPRRREGAGGAGWALREL